MSSTLMPAKGKLEASALAASVASCRTLLGLLQINLETGDALCKANLELLGIELAIL